MKKKYSLDYEGIQRDTDRVIAVKEILDSLDTDPTPAELEQMGMYILYGKDENGLNAVQRGEVTDGNKRYGSFKKKDDKLLSLDEILESPTADQSTFAPLHEKQYYTKKKPTIQKPKYDRKTGEMIDPGDSDIPGMQELWDCIAHLEHTLAVNEGKLPPDEHTKIMPDSYRVYQLKHILIDVRRHQYYLKDAYKPQIHFQKLDRPRPQYYDWSCDSFYWMPLHEWEEKVSHALLHTISKNLEDYETRKNGDEIEVKWVVRRHTFDWTNTQHVRALINNYNTLYEAFRDKLDTYARTIIFDFERYREMAELSEVRQFILDLKIQKYNYTDISIALLRHYNINYNENHLCTILSKEIPEKIALAARKHDALVFTPPDQFKKCYTCGRLLPANNLFFVKNRSRKDKLSSNCKECEKLRRIEKGGQGTNDRRIKEQKVHQVQTDKT